MANHHLKKHTENPKGLFGKLGVRTRTKTSSVRVPARFRGKTVVVDLSPVGGRSVAEREKALEQTEDRLYQKWIETVHR